MFKLRAGASPSRFCVSVSPSVGQKLMKNVKNKLRLSWAKLSTAWVKFSYHKLATLREIHDGCRLIEAQKFIGVK